MNGAAGGIDLLRSIEASEHPPHHLLLLLDLELRGHHCRLVYRHPDARDGICGDETVAEQFFRLEGRVLPPLVILCRLVNSLLFCGDTAIVSFALCVSSGTGPVDPWFAAIVGKANGAANLPGIVRDLEIYIELSVCKQHRSIHPLTGWGVFPCSRHIYRGVVVTLDWFDDRRWSVHPNPSPASPLSLNLSSPLIPTPSNTSTPTFSSTSAPTISFEQFRARAAARREAPTSLGQSQTSVQEDAMDVGSSLDQGPSGSGGNQNDSSHNEAALEATAESTRIIAAYNATPGVARNAQSFTRVRSPHPTPFCFLTNTQLQPRTQLLHLYLAIQEIRSLVSTLANPDDYGSPMPPALEVHHPSLAQHTPTNIFDLRKISRYMQRFSLPSPR